MDPFSGKQSQDTAEQDCHCALHHERRRRSNKHRQRSVSGCHQHAGKRGFVGQFRDENQNKRGSEKLPVHQTIVIGSGGYTITAAGIFLGSGSANREKSGRSGYSVSSWLGFVVRRIINYPRNEDLQNLLTKIT